MLARKTKSSRRGPITASTLKSRDRNNLQRGKLIVIGLERGAALDLLIWLLRLAGPGLVWLSWLALAWLAWLLRLDGPAVTAVCTGGRGRQSVGPANDLGLQVPGRVP